MTATALPLALLVDDDAAIRDSLTWLLRTHGINSRAWESAEAFLADYSAELCGVLVLDIRMTGMTGIELFDELLARACPLPVIFLTGHGDVPQAVAALKKGAFDFLEKPFQDSALVERIQAGIGREQSRLERLSGTTALTQRLATLTEREREIMARILTGKLNKVIADELGIAMRTVEVHRARIFAKMGVRSAVELANLLPNSES
jgi:two-component system response regulator DctR